MRRFVKLDDKTISLGEGKDVLSDKLNPDYIQQPSNPRTCVDCGKIHDCIIENMATGERLSELDKCKECFLFGSLRKFERPETPPALKQWEDGIIAEWLEPGGYIVGEELRRREDQVIRELSYSTQCEFSTIEEDETFDPFEVHACKGGLTETWLVPGGKEFWLIFGEEPKRFTWIEYCPYCGYRPPHLRADWGKEKTSPLL